MKNSRALHLIVKIIFMCAKKLLQFLFKLAFFFNQCYTLDTVQDFLVKLGIKPLMHLLEISIFSLNHDIVRLTKIMNNLVKDLKIRTFIHFAILKSLIFEVLYFLKICPIFFGSVHNFDRSDNDII